MGTSTWLIHGFLWGKGTPFDGGDKAYILYALRIQTGFLSPKSVTYGKNSVGENIREHASIELEKNLDKKPPKRLIQQGKKVKNIFIKQRGYTQFLFNMCNGSIAKFEKTSSSNLIPHSVCYGLNSNLNVYNVCSISFSEREHNIYHCV